MPKASHAAAPHRGARRLDGRHQSSSSLGSGFRGIEQLGNFFLERDGVSARCRRRRAAGWPFRGRPPQSRIAGGRLPPSFLGINPCSRCRSRSPDATSRALRVATGPRARRGAYTRRLSAGPRACRGGESSADLTGRHFGVAGRARPRARPWETLRYGAPRFARRPSAPARAIGLPPSCRSMCIKILTSPPSAGMKCLNYLGGRVVPLGESDTPVAPTINRTAKSDVDEQSLTIAQPKLGSDVWCRSFCIKITVEAWSSQRTSEIHNA